MKTRIALITGAFAAALLLLCLGAVPDPVTAFFPNISVRTNSAAAEIIATNGMTLNGTRITAWPSGGSGTVGTMIKSGSFATGDLPAAQDATGTNWVKALPANIQEALGQVYLPTNPASITLNGADLATQLTNKAPKGAITASDLTMATARVLGRTTAGSGAVEELTAGSSISLSAGSLNTIQDLRTTASPTFVTVNATTGGGSTLLVAASDSPARIKAQADYICDGTADQSEIDTAVDALTSGGTVILAPGNYNFTAAVTVSNSNVEVRFSDGAIVNLSTAITAFTATGSLGASVNVDTDPAIGATTLTLASTTGLAAGDWLKISCDTVYGSTSQEKGEFVRIKSVDSGTQVTLEEPLCDSYETVSTVKPIVQEVTWIQGMVFRNPQITGDADNTLSIGGISLDTCLNSYIQGGNFKRTHYYGILLTDCVQFNVADSHFFDITKAGLAYGVAVTWACQDGIISNPNGINMRHVVTHGGGSSRPGIPRRITTIGLVGTQLMEAGWDAHPAGEDLNCIGATIDGSDNDGIVFQAASGIITDCTVRNSTRHAILIQPSTIKPLNLIVSRNRINTTGGSGSGIVLGLDATYGTTFTSLDVSDNTVVSTGSRGIYFPNTESYRTSRIRLANNHVSASGSHAIFLQKSDDPILTGNSGSFLTNLSGIYLSDVDNPSVTGGQWVGGGAGGTTYCVRFDDVNDATVTGVRGRNAATGLILDNNCTSVTISANSWNGCTAPYSLGTGVGHYINDYATRQAMVLRATGLITENVPRGVSGSATTIMVAGTVYFYAVALMEGEVLNNILIAIQTAQSGAGSSYVGVYDKDGNLLASSADLTTLWETVGLRSAPLSAAYTVPQTGIYYLAILSNAATPPTLFRTVNGSNITGVIGSGIRAAAGQTGQSTLPNPATLGVVAPVFWVGVN